MDRVLARLGRTDKDSKNDGSFVFAISLIVASLTLTYNIYVYLCNNFITYSTFFIVFTSFFIILVIFVSMSLFILMKAISLEVNSLRGKKELETYATSCYLIGFLAGTFYLIYLFASCVSKVVFDIFSYLLNIPNTSPTLLYAYIIIVIITFIIFSYLFKYILKNQIKELRHNILKEINISIVLIIFFLVIIFLLTTLIYIQVSFVTIEADDIYDNKSEQIPIDITVTGFSRNYVTVNLSKADIKDNLKLIDSLNMNNNSDPNKVVSSEYLIGNNLDFGKYKVYINTTNLSEGYYELSVSTKYSKTSMKTNSFYLV